MKVKPGANPEKQIPVDMCEKGGSCEVVTLLIGILRNLSNIEDGAF